MSTVVVTGGSGAIGSRLVRRMLEQQVEHVTVVDNLSSGHEWLIPADPRIQLARGDVCDISDLRLEVDQPLVFHLAALFANQNSVDHPRDDLRTNGFGTLSTLLWASSCGARRFVYASAGCSIAGHGVDDPIREDMPVSLELDTPYQITKTLGEFYCSYFDSQVPTVRCRFFNSYGPGEVPGRYRNVIPNFVWCALHGEPLVITGTGEETRDFIYVDDLVTGLTSAAEVAEARGEAFNLGTGVQTRIIDLAETVIKACRSTSRIEFGPRRPWDRSTHREADIQKARTVLGFRPSIGLCEGVERTVDWFREHHAAIAATVAARA